MSLGALVSTLEGVLLAVGCLTVYKLLKTKLHRFYPIFFVYLLFRIPYMAGGLVLNVKSDLYFYFWFFSSFLAWIFYILTIRELYSLVLERHRGLYTVGRWAMYVGLAISVTISMLYLLPRFRNATAHSKTIAYVYAIDRGVSLSMAIFIVLMLLLLSQYAAVLSRNVVTHALVFAAFFLSNTISTILKSVFGLKVYAATDAVLLGVSAVCTLGWLLFLKPERQEAGGHAPVLGPERESRVLSQLDHLNRTLLNAGKK